MCRLGKLPKYPKNGVAVKMFFGAKEVCWCAEPAISRTGRWRKKFCLQTIMCAIPYVLNVTAARKLLKIPAMTCAVPHLTIRIFRESVLLSLAHVHPAT